MTEKTSTTQDKIKTTVSVAFALCFGVLATVFTVLFFLEYQGESGFLGKNSTWLSVVCGALLGGLTVCSVVFLFFKKPLIYKLIVAITFLISIVVGIFFALKSSGFLDKIDSAKELQQYVSEKGKWAPYLFIFIQFFQVTILPIPGTITIIAGTALFGPLKASLYSLVGIMIGSIASFAIGKTLGYKVSAWFVGEETLDKWLKAVKGKDKVLLTFMFLLPFFPDDILCIVAGLSTMGWTYFIIMTAVCRTVSVFTTAYFGSGMIVPYDTWWGLTLWGIAIIVVCVMIYVLYKKGDKIERWFIDKFQKKEKGKNLESVRSQTSDQENIKKENDYD